MTALATQPKTVNPLTSFRASLKSKIKLYWPLTKPLQSGLLLATGLAGYMSARCPIFSLGTLLGLAGSLFLAIAGSTVLNMWWDRDIDAKMGRTKKRSTSSGPCATDEADACVPTGPSTYGLGVTRATIAISSLLAALMMVVAGYGIGMAWGFLRLLGVLSAGLLMLAVAITFNPSERVNFGMFKYASVYMLAAMILVVIEVI
jgi:heme O synthase-like polyprenyltransferase